MAKEKKETYYPPYPVQLRELYPILQEHAWNFHNRSMHWLILEILDNYAVENGLKKEKRQIRFGKEKNDNAGV
jgi:hypothetical protein